MRIPNTLVISIGKRAVGQRRLLPTRRTRRGDAVQLRRIYGPLAFPQRHGAGAEGDTGEVRVARNDVEQVRKTNPEYVRKGIVLDSRRSIHLHVLDGTVVADKGHFVAREHDSQDSPDVDAFGIRGRTFGPSSV